MNTIQNSISQAKENSARNIRIYSQQYRINNHGLSETLINLLEIHDPFSRSHHRDVADFSTKLARRLGLRQDQIELIRRSSRFHDIGKLGIPKEVILKPAKLTPREYNVVKFHTYLGVGLLQECPDAYDLIPIIKQHHEYYNGQGYPDKIAGSQIKIEARVLSISDAIDAMKSDRPYRKALPKQQIIFELRRCANTQFDPSLVGPAIQILNDKNWNSKAKENSIQ